MKSFRYRAWGFQLYWPRIYFSRKCSDFFMNFDSTLRVAWGGKYRGIGFELLGFGAAVDWERPAAVTKTAQSL